MSAYAPQVRCNEEEKAAFWADLQEVVEQIAGDERCRGQDCPKIYGIYFWTQLYIMIDVLLSKD